MAFFDSLYNKSNREPTFDDVSSSSLEEDIDSMIGSNSGGSFFGPALARKAEFERRGYQTKNATRASMVSGETPASDVARYIQIQRLKSPEAAKLVPEPEWTKEYDKADESLVDTAITGLARGIGNIASSTSKVLGRSLKKIGLDAAGDFWVRNQKLWDEWNSTGINAPLNVRIDSEVKNAIDSVNQKFERKKMEAGDNGNLLDELDNQHTAAIGAVLDDSWTIWKQNPVRKSAEIVSEFIPYTAAIMTASAGGVPPTVTLAGLFGAPAAIDTYDMAKAEGLSDLSATSLGLAAGAIMTAAGRLADKVPVIGRLVKGRGNALAVDMLKGLGHGAVTMNLMNLGNNAVRLLGWDGAKIFMEETGKSLLEKLGDAGSELVKGWQDATATGLVFGASRNPGSRFKTLAGEKLTGIKNRTGKALTPEEARELKLKEGTDNLSISGRDAWEQLKTLTDERIIKAREEIDKRNTEELKKQEESIAKAQTEQDTKIKDLFSQVDIEFPDGSKANKREYVIEKVKEQFSLDDEQAKELIKDYEKRSKTSTPVKERLMKEQEEANAKKAASEKPKEPKAGKKTAPVVEPPPSGTSSLNVKPDAKAGSKPEATTENKPIEQSLNKFPDKTIKTATPEELVIERDYLLGRSEALKESQNPTERLEAQNASSMLEKVNKELDDRSAKLNRPELVAKLEELQSKLNNPNTTEAEKDRIRTEIANKVGKTVTANTKVEVDQGAADADQRDILNIDLATGGDKGLHEVVADKIGVDTTQMNKVLTEARGNISRIVNATKAESGIDNEATIDAALNIVIDKVSDGIKDGTIRKITGEPIITKDGLDLPIRIINEYSGNKEIFLDAIAKARGVDRQVILDELMANTKSLAGQNASIQELQDRLTHYKQLKEDGKKTDEVGRDISSVITNLELALNVANRQLAGSKPSAQLPPAVTTPEPVVEQPKPEAPKPEAQNPEANKPQTPAVTMLPEFKLKKRPSTMPELNAEIAAWKDDKIRRARVKIESQSYVEKVPSKERVEYVVQKLWGDLKGTEDKPATEPTSTTPTSSKPSGTKESPKDKAKREVKEIYELAKLIDRENLSDDGKGLYDTIMKLGGQEPKDPIEAAKLAKIVFGTLTAEIKQTATSTPTTAQATSVEPNVAPTQPKNGLSELAQKILDFHKEWKIISKRSASFAAKGAKDSDIDAAIQELIDKGVLSEPRDSENGATKVHDILSREPIQLNTEEPPPIIPTDNSQVPPQTPAKPSGAQDVVKRKDGTAFTVPASRFKVPDLTVDTITSEPTKKTITISGKTYEVEPYGFTKIKATAKEMLHNIEQSSSHRIYRGVAKVLKKFVDRDLLDEIDFYMANDPTQNYGGIYLAPERSWTKSIGAGRIDPSRRSTVINMHSYGGSPEKAVETVMHELTHAITVNAIQRYFNRTASGKSVSGEYTPEQIRAIKDLERIENLVRKDLLNNPDDYGISSWRNTVFNAKAGEITDNPVLEFVSEVTADKVMATKLMNMRYQGTSVFKRIVNALRRFFGFGESTSEFEAALENILTLSSAEKTATRLDRMPVAIQKDVTYQQQNVFPSAASDRRKEIAKNTKTIKQNEKIEHDLIMNNLLSRSTKSYEADTIFSRFMEKARSLISKQTTPLTKTMILDPSGRMHNYFQDRFMEMSAKENSIIRGVYDIIRGDDAAKNFNPFTKQTYVIDGKKVNIARGQFSYLINQLLTTEAGKPNDISAAREIVKSGIEWRGGRIMFVSPTATEAEINAKALQLRGWARTELANDKKMQAFHKWAEKIDKYIKPLLQAEMMKFGISVPMYDKYLPLARLYGFQAEPRPNATGVARVYNASSLKERQRSKAPIKLMNHAEASINEMSNNARFIGRGEEMVKIRGLMERIEAAKMNGSLTGKVPQSLLDDLMRDINHAEGEFDANTHRMTRWLMRNQDMVRFASPFVAFNQLASIPTIMMKLGVDNVATYKMISGNNDIVKKVLRSKYGSPLYVRVYRGRATNELAENQFASEAKDVTHDKTFIRKFQEYSQAPVRMMDRLTIEMTIKAAASKVSKENPSLKGQDYVDAVAKLATQTVMDTQPTGSSAYRTTFHNSGIWGQILNRYMTVPNAVFNEGLRRVLAARNNPSKENISSVLSYISLGIMAPAAIMMAVQQGKKDLQDAVLDVFGVEKKEEKEDISTYRRLATGMMAGSVSQLPLTSLGKSFSEFMFEPDIKKKRYLFERIGDDVALAGVIKPPAKILYTVSSMQNTKNKLDGTGGQKRVNSFKERKQLEKTLVDNMLTILDEAVGWLSEMSGIPSSQLYRPFAGKKVASGILNK